MEMLYRDSIGYGLRVCVSTFLCSCVLQNLCFPFGWHPHQTTTACSANRGCLACAMDQCFLSIHRTPASLKNQISQASFNFICLILFELLNLDESCYLGIMHVTSSSRGTPLGSQLCKTALRLEKNSKTVHW